MPSWLREAAPPDVGTSPGHELLILAIRLTIAFVYGCMVAGIHRLSAPRSPLDDDDRGGTLTTTLVLLTVLISLVTWVIGNNVARAFSLVGALAIVRFRTVVADTRDTAFVMFSVIAGMAVGTGHVLGPAVCAPLVLAAAWLFRPRHDDAARPAQPQQANLVIRLTAGRAPGERLGAALTQHLGAHRLVSLGTARGGSMLDVVYEVQLPPADRIFAAIEGIGQVDGVQAVELKEP